MYFSFVQGAPFHNGTLVQHFISSAFVDISGRHVIKRLVVSLVIVMGNPLGNGLFKFPGIVVVFRLDHVFHQAVIPFDLALGLRPDC